MGKETKTVLRDSDGQVCVCQFANEKAGEEGLNWSYFPVVATMPINDWVLLNFTDCREWFQFCVPLYFFLLFGLILKA